jgi:hypothetical protein
LKPEYDDLLSNVAFNINARRYYMGGTQVENFLNTMVGRCRLPVSKPVSKAPVVSAL